MSNEIGHSILRNFREFQRLNRFIAVETSIKLSLASTHAVIEIDAHPGITIGELATLLEMPRTSVATLLSSLVRHRLVSLTTSSVDKRSRVMKVTKKGAEFLKLSDPQWNAHLVWLLSPINRKEQMSLANFFREISDGMETPACQPRRTDHALRPQLRRATRALRLIHADFMGSKLGSPEWQMAALLRERARTESISELAKALQIPLSSATTICYRLRQRGFLSSRKSTLDKRASSVALTRRGTRFFQRMENAMAARLQSAVHTVPKDRLDTYMRIFDRVVRAR